MTGRITLPSIRPLRRGDVFRARDHENIRQTIGALLSTRDTPAPDTLARGALVQMRFKSMAVDYLVCRLWDGTNEGAIDINVALPYLLRRIASRDGVSYTYSDGQNREGDDTQDTEEQVMTPTYVLNDVIFAALAAGFTGVDDAPQWIDANIDARHWAKP